jgi:ankyrin repeat protein
MSRFFSVLYHEPIVGLCSDQHNDYLLLEKKLKDLKPDQIEQVINKQLSGETPLTTACQRGSQRTVELLIKYGADPGVKNSNGQLPRELCNHNKEILDILLQESLLAKRTERDIMDTYDCH